MPLSLSIVMPAYNEEGNIERAVREASAAAEDSWPTSRSWWWTTAAATAPRRAWPPWPPKPASRLRVLTHPVNQGYGAALRDGFRATRGELVFYTDSDNQFDLRELEGFLPLMAEADAALGFRVDRQDPFLRIVVSGFFNGLSSLPLGLHVRDLNCSFKLFRGPLIRALPIESHGLLRGHRDGGAAPRSRLPARSEGGEAPPADVRPLDGPPPGRAAHPFCPRLDVASFGQGPHRRRRSYGVAVLACSLRPAQRCPFPARRPRRDALCSPAWSWIAARVTGRADRETRGSTAASSSGSRAPACTAGRSARRERRRTRTFATFRPPPPPRRRATVPACVAGPKPRRARPPGWAPPALVSRALRLIGEGRSTTAASTGWPTGLGVTARHLRRLFLQHLGATPIDVALTRRVHFAKRLLDETALAIHRSRPRLRVRQRPSLQQRDETDLCADAERAPAASAPGSVADPGCYRFRLAYRPPYDWEAALAFLSARATRGVELVEAGRYRRTITLEGSHGTIAVSHQDPGRRSAWRSASPTRGPCSPSSSACAASSTSAPTLR